MGRLKVLAAALFALSLLFSIPFKAQATTVTEAKEMISMLRSQIESLEVNSQEGSRDQAFLLRKLDDAVVLVDQARFCKALKSLNDFSKRLKITLDSSRQGVTVHNRLGEEELWGMVSDIEKVMGDLLTQSGTACNQK